MFGVFDGHGGKFIARKCAEYNWSGERRLEERFWKLDESLGPQSLSSGTTASVMIIEHCKNGNYRVNLAWVGDSQILEIDMTAPDARVTYLTSAHNCMNAAEIDRIHHQWRAREMHEELRSRAYISDGSLPQFGELTQQTFDYEQKLEAAYEHVFASRVCLNGPSLERQPSLLEKRKSRKQEGGVLAIHARWLQMPQRSIVHGASTCVTRSIGDWDASRTLIPHPEVIERLVERGRRKRFVIASDGLWGTIPLKRIAKLAFENRSDPQKCATSLLRHARLECAQLNGVREHPFKDDTTIAVVDVISPPQVAIDSPCLKKLSKESSKPPTMRSWLCSYSTK